MLISMQAPFIGRSQKESFATLALAASRRFTSFMFNKKPPAARPALFTNPPKKAANWVIDSPAGKGASPQSRAPEARAQHVAPAPSRQEPQGLSNTATAAPRAVAPKPTASQPSPSSPLASHAAASVDNGFATLGLREELVRAVLAHGYDTPTPIQKQAIPIVLQGGDLLGGAQTGTGKTAGFVLPLLQRLMQSANAGNASQRISKAPRALILAPTRELAAQVEESVRVYGRFLPLTSTVIYGGVGIQPQVAALRKGVDIVVATPGRLLDHHQQRTIDMSRVEILVLDEADRMLDMGFIHDIKKVLAVLPPKRQNLLFSATFSDEIKALTDRLLNNPQMVEVARRNTTIEVVEQSVVQVEKAHKAKLLIHLVRERNWQQTLVFTRTKHGANRLAEQLEKSGISAMAIHGNKSQSARTKALAEFKAGSLRVLVATDIAARGIDIDQLPQVVNYELPNVPEDYVHRIGRTGRAGASGQAMSLVMQEELPLLKDIERFSKQSIPRVKIEGFNPASIPDPVAPTAEARDQEWAARGGRPAPRGRPGGQGRSANTPIGAPPSSPRAAPAGAPRGSAPKPPGSGNAAPRGGQSRPAGTPNQGRAAPRGGGSGGRGR
jgi:ATP-dependent RNA helicase RhlE